MGKSKAFQLFSLFLLASGFVFIFYGNILLSPNQYQFSAKGDAIKNYYTYAYYIKNNVDPINFEGLNYPYGEHFLYTDCTPVLSSGLKGISSFYPGITNYSVGIMNFLLIISLVLSIFLVYLILLEYDIQHWFAVFSSIGIIALSPQLFRLTGHLALGFGFVIPLSWYLLLKFEKSKNQIKIGLLFLLSNLIIFFIHAYLGMIAAAFLFAYLLVRFIFDYRNKTISKHYYFGLLSIIFIPIIVFRAFIFFTDTHDGRTDNPWGFFRAHADFNTVFLPIKEPLKPIVKSLIGNYEQTWEGWAYIGIASIIAIILYLALSATKSFKIKKPSFDNRWFDNRQLQYILISSILLLIFSMAYPFRLNLEWLLDYVSVLKQFRAVGRFAWVFFFATAISSVYFIDRMSKYFFEKNKRTVAILILFLLPALFFMEALPYHSKISKTISSSPNMFDVQQLDTDLKNGIEEINTDDYQAILPMPFFYIGSENFGKFGTDKIYLLSQITSYHTGLGIIGSYLTRTSIWESKNLMQLMSPGFYEKAIKDDLPNNKKILIALSNEVVSKYEQRVLNLAKLIYKGKDFSFYELKPDEIFKNTASQELGKYKSLKPELFERNGFLTNDTNSFFFYDSFEDNDSDISLSGKGAYTGWKNKYNKLASFKAGTFKPGEKYIASFWMYNAGKNYGQDMLNSMFILQEKEGENSAWSKIVNPAYSMVINGNWSLVEMEFVLKYPKSETTFMLKGSDYHKKQIYIDEFMIYKANSLNYRNINSRDSIIYKLIKNNHHIVFD